MQRCHLGMMIVSLEHYQTKLCIEWPSELCSGFNWEPPQVEDWIVPRISRCAWTLELTKNDKGKSIPLCRLQFETGIQSYSITSHILQSPSIETRLNSTKTEFSNTPQPFHHPKYRVKQSYDLFSQTLNFVNQTG